MPAHRIAYQPALDGMRALAVAAVLAYHADFSWAKGGFLGVDAFFVLSGYLITTLLLTEWRDTEGIGLLAFWGRRARRLLPALFLMIGGVAIYAVAFAEPEEFDNIRRDALATLFYVANWNEVFTGTSYFTQFELPSPLRHAWSLAIEEQFYLVWPLVVVFFLRTFPNPRRLLAGATLVIIIASAALMALLYDPNADPSRVYYGTDTRAHSLLVGALLAMGLFWYPQLAGFVRHSASQLVAIAAAAGIGLVWILVPDDSSALYYGGYLLFALAVAAVIAVVVQPERGPLAMMLGAAPLRGLGLISYGVYLWHWPLYLMLSPDRTGLDGATLMTVRVALTLAVSMASYSLLELPIRRGVLGRVRASWVLAPAAAVALVIGVVVVTRDSAPLYAVPGPDAATLTSLLEDEAAPRVLLVGDSMAKSMATGLYATQAETGIAFRDASADGCGVMPANEDHFARLHCDAARDRWRPHIETFQPHVVLLMTSPWDGLDPDIDDARLMQEWESTFREALQDAIDTLSARGARIVLLTVPYFLNTDRGTVGQVDQLNAVGKIVAQENGSRVTTVDLNRFLSVNGAYSREIDGIQVRSSDNVHFTEEGARFVSVWLAPKLIQAAELAARPVDGSESPPQNADSTYALGLASDGNFLLNADSSPRAWRGWNSTLRTIEDGILVSSNDIAYSAFLSIPGTEMNLAPGQTYVATVWVRASTESAVGRIAIIVREGGAREEESSKSYALWNIWQPILVEHTVTQPDLTSLEVHVLRLGTTDGDDAFVFREAQLRQIIE